MVFEQMSAQEAVFLEPTTEIRKFDYPDVPPEVAASCVRIYIRDNIIN